MKNELDYKVAVRAKETFLYRINNGCNTNSLCGCFDHAYFLHANSKYQHPLFTYENALQFGAKLNEDNFWWDIDDSKSRIKFLDWIIENS